MRPHTVGCLSCPVVVVVFAQHFQGISEQINTNCHLTHTHTNGTYKKTRPLGLMTNVCLELNNRPISFIACWYYLYFLYVNTWCQSIEYCLGVACGRWELPWFLGAQVYIISVAQPAQSDCETRLFRAATAGAGLCDSSHKVTCISDSIIYAFVFAFVRRRTKCFAGWVEDECGHNNGTSM